jgi:hypothetical protein
MRIPVKLAGGIAEGGIPEWVILELQGEVVARGGLAGQELGTLIYDEGSKATLTIGSHRLDGKEYPLPAPFFVTRKVTEDGETEQEGGDQALVGDSGRCRTVYKVIGKVTKKLLFKQRPKPLIGAARQRQEGGAKKM